jgi:hypothetical protein
MVGCAYQGIDAGQRGAPGSASTGRSRSSESSGVEGGLTTIIVEVAGLTLKVAEDHFSVL